MEQKITIVYDPVARTVTIENNDFTTFEAFGLLEAAKQMIAQRWLEAE